MGILQTLYAFFRPRPKVGQVYSRDLSFWGKVSATKVVEVNKRGKEVGYVFVRLGGYNVTDSAVYYRDSTAFLYSYPYLQED